MGGNGIPSETLLCAQGFCQTIQVFDLKFFLLIFVSIYKPQETILFNTTKTKIFDFVNHLKNM